MNYYPTETLDKVIQKVELLFKFETCTKVFVSKGYDGGRRPSPTLIRVSAFKNIVGPNLVRSKTSCAPGSGPIG